MDGHASDDNDDMDVDLGGLIAQVQNITTQDHSVLIVEFSNLVGCSEDMCRFFLEANSWNLQAAIVSYFDAGGAQIARVEDTPQMVLVCDVVDGNPTQQSAMCVHTNAMFQKCWRVRNCGAVAWPNDTYLVTQTGASLGANTFDMLTDSVKVPALLPGDSYDVTIVGKAPPMEGEYAMVCRLGSEESGCFFGDELFLFCSVNPAPMIAEPTGNIPPSSLDDMDMMAEHLE